MTYFDNVKYHFHADNRLVIYIVRGMMFHNPQPLIYDKATGSQNKVKKIKMKNETL